jgi:hypothetical protein
MRQQANLRGSTNPTLQKFLMWLRHTTANEHGPNGSAANAYFQSSPAVTEQIWRERVLPARWPEG